MSPISKEPPIWGGKGMMEGLGLNFNSSKKKGRWGKPQKETKTVRAVDGITRPGIVGRKRRRCEKCASAPQNGKHSGTTEEPPGIQGGIHSSRGAQPKLSLRKRLEEKDK